MKKVKNVVVSLFAFLLVLGLATVPAQAYVGKYTVVYASGGRTDGYGIDIKDGTIRGTFYYNITFNNCGTGYAEAAILTSSDQHEDEGNIIWYSGTSHHWYKGYTYTRYNFTSHITTDCGSWVFTITSNSSYYA